MAGRHLMLLIFLSTVAFFKTSYSQDTIRFVKACSIDTFYTNKLVTQSIKMSDSNELLCKKLLYGSAQQNAKIYFGNSNDPYVNFAVAGITGDGVVCILLNEENLENHHFTPKMTFTFLAHELGHINHFHYVKKEPLDTQDELNADFYSGFCSAREGLSPLESTNAFKLLEGSEDDIHPPYPIREARILAGYKQLSTPSPYPDFWRSDRGLPETIDKSLIKKIKSIKADSSFFENSTYAMLLEKYLSAVCVIRPLANYKGKEWHSFSLSIHSNSPKLPNDTLMSFIDKVDYKLHKTFPRELVQVVDRKSNFEYSIPTWGDSDIVVIVTFKDESVASFVYNLRLQPKQGMDTQFKNNFLQLK